MSNARDLFDWDRLPLLVGTTNDPVAGAVSADVTVPAGRRWKVYGMTVTIVCAAVAATRIPYYTVAHNGTTIDMIWGGITGATTGQTRSYRWINGLSVENTGMAVLAGILEPFLAFEISAGAVISPECQAIDAGDNLSATIYLYKEAML